MDKNSFYFLNKRNIKNRTNIILYGYKGKIYIFKPLIHIFNTGNHYHSLNNEILYNYNKTNSTFRDKHILSIWWRNNYIDKPQEFTKDEINKRLNE